MQIRKDSAFGNLFALKHPLLQLIYSELPGCTQHAVFTFNCFCMI